MERDLQIRPYTFKELNLMYGCSAKTFRKWLRKIDSDLGPRMGNFYNPRQVRIIFEKLGVP
ncbi:MAG: hypothetical protein U0289_18100 [Cyclobacteriaceae bacterium]|jgi:hypothetical protein